MDNTIRNLCQMGGDFEDMVKRACSLEDIIFTAKVNYF